MRKLLAGATVLMLGAGAAPMASAQVLQLKGSDTLEEVTKAIVAACPGLGSPATINYVGGGSGGGENAMNAAAPTQQIAPMSRQIGSGTVGSATCGNVAGQELLIGLDGIAVVAGNQLKLDSTTSACGDTIVGYTAPRTVAITDCSAPGAFCDGGLTVGPGTYTFNDWKDVLAVVYGGQNHNAAGGSALTATFPKTRNPARINCAGLLRQTVVSQWANLFTDDVTKPSCRSPSCTILKHAFRRGGTSGTSDTFVTLVGLPAIPAYTTTSALNFPTVNPASATADPFCNAGDAPMNKGDSDYLDLDPIRRIADSEAAAPNNRLGHEQVAEGFLIPANPPVSPPADPRAQPVPLALADFGASNKQNVGPDPNNATWAASEAAALPNRKGLGLVLPIEIPTNYSDETFAYWATAPGGPPVLCDPGVFATSLPDSSVGICPDGSTPPCAFPVHVNADSSVNYNCLTAGPVPASPPLRDSRVYNLNVVRASDGHYVKDGYVNGNLTLPAATRQNRVVSAFFRLHASQVEFASLTGGSPTGGPCTKFDSTAQIGCLVEASPCSIGFAGREAVDVSNASLAFRLGDPAAPTSAAGAIACNKATIEHLNNLDGTGLTAYPMARRLWINASKGLVNVTDTVAAPSTPVGTFNEGQLLKCFGYDPTIGTLGGNNTTSIQTPVTGIDAVITSHRFVPVPDSGGAVGNRVKTCGPPP